MSWLGINTAMTGMFTSQRNLYTVNHNVANADKEGYSRQKVVTSSNIPLHVPGKGYIGTGIGTDSVVRIRDTYLDKKYRSENASLGKWDMKNNALSEIEGVLRGSNEEGINVNVDELFASIEELSRNPSDTSYRTSFREKAIALTNTMNETSKRLYKQQNDLNFEVKTKVKQVNDYAEQISSLNNELFVMEIDGSNANDLRDQRDLMLDKLSKLVDIEFEERTLNVENVRDQGAVAIKKFEIRVGGKLLVDHDQTSKLKYPPDRMTNTLNPEESLYKVEWESGDALKLKGGEIRGLLEVRDGGYSDEDEVDASADGKFVKAEFEYSKPNGIPYYIKKLDEFAKVFAQKLNDIHKDGINLNGEKETFLFTMNGKNTSEVKDSTDVSYLYKNIRADNISVSGDILSDLRNIATIDGDKENVEDNGTMKSLLKTREDTSFFGPEAAYRGKPEDYLTSILSTLGTDNQQASRMKRVEDLVVKSATNQRLSVSGVNLDEEMADMVKFQQIFNASAKMITTFDQIYDTMINRLGTFGR